MTTAAAKARKHVPAVARLLLQAIEDNGLPNHFSPAELSAWSGTLPADTIARVGRAWMGDLLDAIDRDDLDIRFLTGFFTISKRKG